jgi:guanidinobutyrase
MTKTYYQPLGANEMPKFAGPATFMRLPARDDAEGLDACFVGVPFDMGSSNRVGARFGPRQIRMESTPIRPYNMATRAAPFDSLSVADIGDVAVNPYNLKKSIEILRGCLGLDIVGGDLVEVSPPYDPLGNTACIAANLLYEMLCSFPGVERQ